MYLLVSGKMAQVIMALVIMAQVVKYVKMTHFQY